MDIVTDDKHVIIEDQERPLVWIAKPKPTERRAKVRMGLRLRDQLRIIFGMSRCSYCQRRILYTHHFGWYVGDDSVTLFHTPCRV